MGTEPGENLTHLIEDLKSNAPEYSFFHAVFLSEMLTQKWHPQRDDNKFEQTGLTFRPFEMYVYPPRDIRSFEFDKNTITFILNFMGLYGINSPLPRCFHNQVALQQNIHGAGNVPLQNFMDIFHNRFYWLYYQAWKKYRYYLQLGDTPHNKTMQRLHSFIGTGHLQSTNGESTSSSHKEKQPISTFKLLQLSGILCNRVRNKEGLQILLKEFFPKIQIKIHEFFPKMVKLMKLPSIGKGTGERIKLGSNSVLGKSVIDYMSCIGIEIGPISFTDYLEFTVESANAALLRKLLKLYLHDGLEYNIKFTVKSESIKSVCWNDPRLRLGSTMWLGKPKQDFMNIDIPYERFARVN